MMFNAHWYLFAQPISVEGEIDYRYRWAVIYKFSKICVDLPKSVVRS